MMIMMTMVMITMMMSMTKADDRFFPNLEEIPEESRCSTIMKERKEEEGGLFRPELVACESESEDEKGKVMVRSQISVLLN